MAVSSTSFEKGNKGKPKGALAKTTQKGRELFLSIMEGEVDNIKGALDEVRHENKAKYLEVISKLMPFFIPKKMEIDNKEPININVTREIVK